MGWGPIDSLISKEYNRLRVGVGKPQRKSEVASYVLSDFSQNEQSDLDTLIEYAAKVALKWAEGESLDILKSKYSKKDISYIR